MKIPVLALSLSLCSAAALAALGGAPSMPVARVLSSTMASSSPAPTFTESKQTLESGTEVHEWVNAAGLVFAISWSGPYLPDLRDQLGTHFQALTDGQQRNPGSRSRASVQQADLVIFSAGRMGAFEGRAWIPSLLPGGFDTAAIK